MPNKTKPHNAHLPLNEHANDQARDQTNVLIIKNGKKAMLKEAIAEEVIRDEKVTKGRVTKKEAVKKEAVKKEPVNKKGTKGDAVKIAATVEVDMVEPLDKQPMDKGVEGVNIGSRLNHLRLSKGYSQRKLARLAGLTNTAISSIERNKVSPAVNTLNAILAVLDFDLQSFFSEDWEEATTQVIVKPKDLVEISEANSAVSIKQVYSYATNRNLGFLIETYQPNSSTEEKIAHEGEEIGTVIEGEIVIHTDNTAYFLTTGDSYVIDTSHPHTFVNSSSNITRIVSAHTPATF